MNKYPKSILVTVLIIVCTAFVMECLHRSPLFTEPGPAGAQSVGPARFTFGDLLDAIEWVESKGKVDAIGDDGAAVGAYQIHKIYVDDVNRIWEDLFHDDAPVFAYSERTSRTMSRWMATIYLKHYGGTFEEMARKHNGGPQGHKKESTKPYWEKVKARLEAVGDQYAKELMVWEVK